MKSICKEENIGDNVFNTRIKGCEDSLSVRWTDVKMTVEEEE